MKRSNRSKLKRIKLKRHDSGNNRHNKTTAYLDKVSRLHTKYNQIPKRRKHGNSAK